MNLAAPLRYALVLSLLALVVGTAAVAEDLNRAELARVRYELSKVETRLSQAGGQPIELRDGDKEAFRLVQDLAKRFPDHPDVAELVTHARALYNQAKGVRFEITPAMVAYRQRGARLATTMGEAATAAWAKLVERVADERLATPFPVPMPPEADPSEIEDRLVILEGVPYEESLFVQSGVNWVPAGEASTGFYWIRGSGRNFASLWEALRRFRASVKEDLPKRWTFVGRIEGPDLLVPESSEDTIGDAQMGLTVTLEAIYVPGTVLVELDADAPDGASFAGEERLASLRTFTVTSVPDDVEPADLVRIYVTALKERNWDLHLECIDPGLRKSGIQMQNLRYVWELQQRGLENVYAHAEPSSVAEIRVISGGVDEDLESFFGEEETAGTVIRKEERVTVEVRLYDERGVQVVRPRYVTLIRLDGGRWYIWGGGTLLF